MKPYLTTATVIQLLHLILTNGLPQVSNFLDDLDVLSSCERAIWSCCQSDRILDSIPTNCFEGNGCMGLQWLGKDACSAENVDAVTQVFQDKTLFSPKNNFQEEPNKDDSYMTESIFKATAEYGADDKLTKIRVTMDGGKEIIITDEERLNKFEETQKESTSTNKNMGSLISSTAKSTTSITTTPTTTTITPSSLQIPKSGSSFECKGVIPWTSIIGIEQWCIDNCQRGYCPENVCDCNK